ncbi:efflux transporter outer membrane subunit [Roseateles toxinivorans]|uniref:NodT family efflux transporter outer membrane factor (OMF) lipoprotein n=1 Tax=Roseateles toxinivorans TaxID=270368 RepID=A0A4R6QMH3_9BURK|nr:efflux transporter outer membrane subunit [Roseateles toxinivorans]TDP71320.1 NodT family efflux transporter outer membrane factor (OMF) lipoprotein [Roseateles toxinivorans]
MSIKTRFKGTKLATLALAALLSACAATAPTVPALSATPVAWAAPLPHGGQGGQLKQWWSRLDDEALVALIASAQQSNPSIDVALARMAQARAQLGSSRADQGPQLNGTVSSLRSRPTTSSSARAQTLGTVGLDASWELDLFAQRRRQILADEARAQAGELSWHSARVSLAAEVAQTYLAFRACEAGAAILAQDAEALSRMSGLTAKKVAAGMEAQANGQQLDASAADARSRHLGQQAECEVLIKGLVALSGKPEAELRQLLKPGSGRLPQAAAFEVASVPAQVLAQRPDVAAAERQVMAALAEVGSVEAAGWPQLRLGGALSRGELRVGGGSDSGTGWSIGPILHIPLFDSGLLRAAVDAARARSDEAYAQYRASAIQAVREVEEALVRLDAAQAREADARRAASGYEQVQGATAARWQAGLGNLIELEESRRNALNARSSLLQVQRERVGAWLSLYKAAGGGWDRSDPMPQATVSR